MPDGRCNICGQPAVCTYEHVWVRFPLKREGAAVRFYTTEKDGEYDTGWHYVGEPEYLPTWEVECEAANPILYLCAKHEEMGVRGEVAAPVNPCRNHAHTVMGE